MVSKEGHCKTQNVRLDSLSNLSGLSEDLIKQELSVDVDNMTMNDLRLSMLKYLDKTFSEIKKADWIHREGKKFLDLLSDIFS